MFLLLVVGGGVGVDLGWCSAQAQADQHVLYQAGNYTPESSVEHPAAVEQLAEEYARAGGDITQTFTYYSRDVGTPEGCNLTVSACI